MSSPTTLTLRELRKLGWYPAVVEYWSSFSNKRHDLWGCIDIIALKGKRIMAVQCTAYSGMSARSKKILSSEALPHIAEAEIEIEVWGWAKVCQKCGSMADTEAHAKKCPGKARVWSAKRDVVLAGVPF